MLLAMWLTAVCPLVGRDRFEGARWIAANGVTRPDADFGGAARDIKPVGSFHDWRFAKFIDAAPALKAGENVIRLELTAPKGMRPAALLSLLMPDGTRTTKFLMSEGFHQAPSHPRAKASVVCNFALDELPKGDVRFVVTPMNCFHTRGRPLVSDWSFAR